MFRNLEAEIVRQGMNNKSFALSIGMKYLTFRKKILGITQFHLDEMNTIKKAFGDDLTLEYLFEQTE